MKATRSLILSRLSDIAPHKYGIHYSGETFVSWDTLKKIPEYTSRCSNLGLSWWSHDIGGYKNGVEDNLNIGENTPSCTYLKYNSLSSTPFL